MWMVRYCIIELSDLQGENEMKKFVSLALALCMGMALLAGCSSETDNSTSESSVSSKAETSESPVSTSENSDTDYESCVWSVDEMAKMVQLAKKYINCKIMGPECFGWDSHKYNLELANKSAAVRASIDIWGNHIYGTNDWSYVKKVTDLTKKPMWMTEICQQDKSRLGKWSDACDFAEQVDSCMRVGFSAYVYYNMLDNFFGDGTDGSKTSQPGKWAYILSHYAKFATGKTRIQATFSNTSLKGTAYMSEDGDTISLFILNPGATSTTLRVRLPFACAQVRSVITNEFRNFYQQDVSEEYGGTLNPRLSIMASTIHTFQFVRTEPTETPDPQPGETTLLDAYKAATQVNPINPHEQ